MNECSYCGHENGGHYSTCSTVRNLETQQGEATPRTDAEESRVNTKRLGTPLVTADFARQLERELADREREIRMLHAGHAARDAAQSASVAWEQRADITERQVAWIDRDARYAAVVVSGREFLLTLPPLPLASTAKKEGE